MEFRAELAGESLAIAAPFDGVAFRRFRGAEDYGEMARLLMATSRADGGYRYETRERVAVGYENLYNCDPYEDMIFAEVEGKAVGYSRVFWENQLNGTRAYGAFGWLDPEYRFRGIGTAMYEANEARVRSMAATHPAELPKQIMTYVAVSDVSGVRLCEKHGFTPDMYLADMVRPDLENIPKAPMPPGLLVRTPTPDEYRKVWEADVEAFRDHRGAAERQETWFDEFLADPNFDPRLWRVAWDGDEVAGQVPLVELGRDPVVRTGRVEERPVERAAEHLLLDGDVELESVRGPATERGDGATDTTLRDERGGTEDERDRGCVREAMDRAHGELLREETRPF